MEKWTISSTIEDVFRLHINWAGRPKWVCFAYRIENHSEVATFEVRLGEDVNPVTKKWFAGVKRGMLDGYDVSRQRGRQLVNLVITVLRIDEHPIDTDDYICERYGRQFVSDLAFWNSAAIRVNEEA